LSPIIEPPIRALIGLLVAAFQLQLG